MVSRRSGGASEVVVDRKTSRLKRDSLYCATDYGTLQRRSNEGLSAMRILPRTVVISAEGLDMPDRFDKRT